jgi:hypothetical protein
MKYKLEIIDSGYCFEMVINSYNYEYVAELMIERCDKNNCYEQFEFQQNVILYLDDIEVGRFVVNREPRPEYILEKY